MSKLLSTLILFTMLITSSSCIGRETILLTPTNTINLRGEINDSSAIKVLNDYFKLSKNSTEQLYLVINSPGGDVIAGLDLLKFLKTVPNLKVICMYCVSMAHQIVQHLPAERLATPDNQMMQHRAAGGVNGQLNDGELESRLAHIKALLTEMEIVSAERIGVSLEKYKLNIINEWWTYGEQSLEQGMVDRIVDIKCSQELIDLRESSIERGFFSEYEVISYGCPLLVFPAAVNQVEQQTL